jgi:hypothetical protein
MLQSISYSYGPTYRFRRRGPGTAIFMPKVILAGNPPFERTRGDQNAVKVISKVISMIISKDMFRSQRGL